MEEKNRKVTGIIVTCVSIVVVIIVIMLIIMLSEKKTREKDVTTQTTKEVKTTTEYNQIKTTMEDKNTTDTTKMKENTVEVTKEKQTTSSATINTTSTTAIQPTTERKTTVVQPASPQTTKPISTNPYVQNNSSNDSSYVDEVIRIVNEERARQGLQPLKKSNDLCKVAAIRATETISLFSHTRPNGQSCFSILKEYHIPYMTVGENIAAGQQTPAEVMNSWMNSQGHRENIMNSSFGQIGVGVVRGGSYGIYWVQMFTN